MRANQTHPALVAAASLDLPTSYRAELVRATRLGCARWTVTSADGCRWATVDTDDVAAWVVTHGCADITPEL